MGTDIADVLQRPTSTQPAGLSITRWSPSDLSNMIRLFCAEFFSLLSDTVTMFYNAYRMHRGLPIERTAAVPGTSAIVRAQYRPPRMHWVFCLPLLLIFFTFVLPPFLFCMQPFIFFAIFSRFLKRIMRPFD